MSSSTVLAHTWIGTPYYMSPEALLHKGYNEKSDVWSLGVILFELCALKRPFTGLTFPQVTKQIIQAPCPKLPDRFSDPLQSILDRLLCKDPEERASTNDLLKTAYIERQMESLARGVTLSFTGDASRAKENADMIKNLWNKRNKPVEPQTTDPSRFNEHKRNHPLMKTAPHLEIDEDDVDVISPRELMLLKRKVEADARADELRYAIPTTRK
ncbi:Serine/threonine-protein kinase Nek11 [Cichlidogyrus casuarinus]|uniref:non-specific serine/threonine protein kinase n=1 Tax=Cichlidogyrus casuarinus TaxID=1844966 RepID=A0ABD2QJ75_9PLAT